MLDLCEAVDADAVQALVARSRRDVDEGVLPSVQLALAHHGELALSETFGAGDDARYVTFSVTKAFTAAAVWLLLGDGRLSADTRVCDVIPEFTTNGKETVTVEHLLTHTAGFPRAPMRPEEGADRAQRVERFTMWRLDWEPGTQTTYHATSAYWVLAELIDRLVGKDFRSFFASGVAAPLGLPRLQLGVPVGEQQDIVDVVLVGDADEAVEGLGERVQETEERHLLRFNEPEVRAAGVPGAGGVGSAADVALFYQALLHNPDGLWDQAVLDDATGHVRNTLVDPLMNVPANRTLGLVVAGDDGMALHRQFGKTVGPRTFGAMGVGGQIAWADPDTGLSFCYLTNGLDTDVVSFFTRSAKLAGLAGRCARPEHATG